MDDDEVVESVAGHVSRFGLDCAVSLHYRSFLVATRSHRSGTPNALEDEEKTRGLFDDENQQEV